MEIHSNQELSETIENLIQEHGIKKIWLSEKIGIANQNLNRLLSKKVSH